MKPHTASGTIEWGIWGCLMLAEWELPENELSSLNRQLTIAGLWHWFFCTS